MGGSAASALAQPDDTIVVLNTEVGGIAIELFPDVAPNHADNFVRLSEGGFYTGTVFHRIIPGFMIQGGDPLTAQGESTMDLWGTGGPDRRLAQEFNDIQHVRGIVSMARSSDPDSAGSQFFIVHADSPHLDGQYTAFGRIVTSESFETLDKIASLETTNTKPDDWESARVVSVDVLARSDIGDGLLDLGPPAGAGGRAAPADHQPYRNEALGIRFDAPAGWLVQEPPKSSPEVPDVVAVAPGPSQVNPSISITAVQAAGRTLEQYVEEHKKQLDPAVELGQLAILDEGFGDVSGRSAYTINASGPLPGGEAAEDVWFTETTFLEDGRFFTFRYAAAASEHGAHYDDFVKSVESFEASAPAAPPPPAAGPGGGGNGGGCLIATAAYGSEMAPQVQLLREIRDSTVLATPSGAAFMAGLNQIYYSFSPAVADWERQNPLFREAVRAAITPMLATLTILDRADSDHGVLAYGAGIIALNAGIYVAAPAAAAYAALKRRSPNAVHLV